MSLRNVSLLFVGLALAGCATEYQKIGLTGGFEEKQLAPNVWRVTFSGNGYTSRQRGTEFIQLRGADLTLQNGYAYFILVGEGVGAAPVTNKETAEWQLVATSIVEMFKVNSEAPANAFQAQSVCASLGAKYNVPCGKKL